MDESLKELMVCSAPAAATVALAQSMMSASLGTLPPPTSLSLLSNCRRINCRECERRSATPGRARWGHT